MNLDIKHAHMVGIEGSGMSAIAFVMIASGISVTGSDLNPGKLS